VVRSGDTNLLPVAGMPPNTGGVPTAANRVGTAAQGRFWDQSPVGQFVEIGKLNVAGGRSQSAPWVSTLKVEYGLWDPHNSDDVETCCGEGETPSSRVVPAARPALFPDTSMKSRRPCDRCRLKRLSFVLSLLFNPALSQPAWFESKRLSTVPFGSTHFRGPDEAAGTGRTADSYSGLRELVRASGRPLLWSGRPLSAPTPLSLACSSVLDGNMVVLAAESGWGLSRSVMAGGWGFYLALAATISASELLISNLPPSNNA
jgi:hypothetical protein